MLKYLNNHFLSEQEYLNCNKNNTSRILNTASVQKSIFYVGKLAKIEPFLIQIFQLVVQYTLNRKG